MRALTYYVAVTLDGYIAGPDGQIDAFQAEPAMMEHIVEHYPETLPTPARNHLGIDGPGRRFDAVVMGRGTYQLGLDEGLTSPYAHLDQTVFSASIDPSVDPGVTITDEDPVAVVERLKADAGAGVWLCGGGQLAGTLVDQIDELIVKRQPQLFGTGRPMIAGHYRPTDFELVERQSIGSASVERYRRSDTST